MQATIVYDQTMYRCKCQCGQTFYLSAGHCLRKKVPLPHLAAAVCPNCGLAAWLTYRKLPSSDMPHYRGRKKAAMHALPAHVLHEDQQHLEDAVELYQRRYRITATNLAALEGAVRNAIAAWRDNWRSSVMPRQFQALIRCLHEQTPIT